ncbi:MAG: DNA recombination protein RmuC, partial [Clostridium sp.]
VVQYSYAEKVYMVSPTTLMAYLTAIRAIYLGVQRNEHVEQIQQELKHLQVEFERFDKRYQAVSNDFERSYQDMRQLSITAGKIVKRFEEIQEVQLEKKEETASE